MSKEKAILGFSPYQVGLQKITLNGGGGVVSPVVRVVHALEDGQCQDVCTVTLVVSASHMQTLPADLMDRVRRNETTTSTVQYPRYEGIAYETDKLEIGDTLLEVQLSYATFEPR